MVIQNGCLQKINEECKSSGNLNITTNNKSNINNHITNTIHMLFFPIKVRCPMKLREGKELLNQ